MKEEIEHKIVITFKNDGSALYDIEIFGNIYAEQCSILAADFRYQSARMKEDLRMAQMMAEQNRKERDQILVPNVKLG